MTFGGFVIAGIVGQTKDIYSVSQDAVLLRVSSFTLTGAAKRWVYRLTPGAVNTWDLLKKAFIQRYCPLSKTAKRLEDIHNFKNKSDESLYQVWERYNDLLYKCPTHAINNHQKVNIFYKGLSTMNRQFLDSQGPIPDMTPTQALTAIQTMVDHSQKWHDGTSSRNISSGSNADGLAAIVSKLDNLGRDMKKLKENVHAIQVECQICKGPHLEKECPLNEEVKQVEEVNYGEVGRPAPFNKSNRTKFCVGFLDDEKSENTEVKTSKVIHEWKSNIPEQSVNHYVEPYAPPIPFPNRLKQHAEEALVYKTMKSLKKIKINRPLLKEIRQTNNYHKYMKDLVANKQLTEDDDEVRMSPRCSTLLHNLLPPKENDPGSFILPCSIGRLDFNNALADQGASINIMPFFMFKRLGMGKLKPINMVIEMADDTKCIPKGIVKNLLIKINKFILPIDFVLLDIIEDFRMPVGNEKVIFKTRSNFSNNIHESVRMIKTQMNVEEVELMKIDSDLFTYNTNACEINHLLSIDTDVFTYDIEVQESYEEIVYRKRFENEYDDNEEFEDPDGCGESKENEILGTILNKLHDEWFKGTNKDDDDLEGSIDYLEPTLYDRFIDSDNEEYKKMKCILLGIPYIKPPPILIEKVNVTRYSIGPG
ncbi:hypothetical protein Tco_0900141 [Tanacetum coccineum]